MSKREQRDLLEKKLGAYQEAAVHAFNMCEVLDCVKVPKRLFTRAERIYEELELKAKETKNKINNL